jgi:hypothetical protein
MVMSRAVCTAACGFGRDHHARVVCGIVAESPSRLSFHPTQVPTTRRTQHRHSPKRRLYRALQSFSSPETVIGPWELAAPGPAKALVATAAGRPGARTASPHPQMPPTRAQLGLACLACLALSASGERVLCVMFAGRHACVCYLVHSSVCPNCVCPAAPSRHPPYCSCGAAVCKPRGAAFPGFHHICVLR